MLPSGEAPGNRTQPHRVATCDSTQLVHASWHGIDESNACSRFWRPLCYRNTYPANGSSHRIRTYSVEINNLVPLPLWTDWNKIGATKGTRTLLYCLEGSNIYPLCYSREWCSLSGSNGDPRFFRPVHRPSLLRKRNGSGRGARIPQRCGYEPCD